MGLLALAVGAPSACAGEVELAQGEVEMILRFSVQVALVPFQREEVVASLGGDFSGNVGVGAHRIDTDGMALEVECVEQTRDRFDLIALLRDELLGEGDSAFPSLIALRRSGSFGSWRALDQMSAKCDVVFAGFMTTSSFSLMITLGILSGSVPGLAGTHLAPLVSGDLVIGEAAPNARAPGYFVGEVNEVVGSTGSEGSGTREHRNVIVGFAMPILDGLPIQQATLRMETTGSSDSGGEVAVDLYGLSASDPDGTAVALFFEGENDTGQTRLVEGFASTSTSSGTQLAANVTNFVRDRYSGDDPAQEEVFFRLNLDREINALSGGVRRVNFATAGATLEIVTGEEPPDTVIDSVSKLNFAIQTAVPGDILVVEDGIYQGSAIRLAGAGGTEGETIQVRARNRNAAVIMSPVTFSAPNVVWDGFLHEGGGKITINSSADGAKILNTEMNAVSTSQWITLNHADRVEIGWCSFLDKSSSPGSGQQLIAVQRNGEPERHHFHHNLFRDIEPGSGNGYETIRLGLSQDVGTSFTVIEDNVFLRANGEAEIISVKCEDNIVRRNSFLESTGSLTFRHGNRNHAIANFFDGGNVAGSRGFRMQGEGNRVLNNYFTRLRDGSDPASFGNDGAAIAIHDGDPEDFYIRSRNCVVAFNSIIDCDKPFVIGLSHPTTAGSNLPPENLTIANNVVENAAGPVFNFPDDDAVNLVSVANVANGSSLGIADPGGVFEISAGLEADLNGLFRPAMDSPLVDAAKGDFEGVVEDLSENVRPMDIREKDLGALERVDLSGRAPWGASQVGAGKGPVSVDVAPEIPTGLTATAVSSGTVRLQWTDASVNETVFEIESRSAGGGFVFADLAAADSPGVFVADLEADSGYGFRVRSKNAAGASAWTGEAMATTSPGVEQAADVYQEWSTGIDWGATPLSEREPGADPDGDCLRNTQEMALGSPPLSGAGMRWPTLEVGARVRVFYPKPFGDRVNYAVERSPDLTEWFTDGVGPEQFDSATGLFFRMVYPPAQASSQFFILKTGG